MTDGMMLDLLWLGLETKVVVAIFPQISRKMQPIDHIISNCSNCNIRVTNFLNKKLIWAFLWVFIQLTDSVRKSSWHGSFVPNQDHHKCWLKHSIYIWWELDFIGLKIQMHRMFQSRSCVTKLGTFSDHS